jgi:hypothetical protein
VKIEIRSDEATYNDTVVRQFAIMTIVWGVVGMLVGVVIAAQLAFPALNFDVPWLSYGRLRPLHTNAVIFAFGGCALFATSYYAVQRTCQTRLFARPLAAFTFWGWQATIAIMLVSLPLGLQVPPAGGLVQVGRPAGASLGQQRGHQAAQLGGRDGQPNGFFRVQIVHRAGFGHIQHLTGKRQASEAIGAGGVALHIHRVARHGEAELQAGDGQG